MIYVGLPRCKLNTRLRVAKTLQDVRVSAKDLASCAGHLLRGGYPPRDNGSRCVRCTFSQQVKHGSGGEPWPSTRSMAICKNLKINPLWDSSGLSSTTFPAAAVASPFLSPLRHAAFWGLSSSVFAALSMIQYIYLYNRRYVKGGSPHGLVLCLFGIAGSIAIAIGIGGIGAYLGLGIIDSTSGNGERVCVCVYSGNGERGCVCVCVQWQW